MSILSNLGTALRLSHDAGLRQAQVNRLNALSDKELADMGITRERIVQHVYRDIIGL